MRERGTTGRGAHSPRGTNRTTRRRGTSEEVGDGSLGEGDGPDAAPAEEVG